MTFARLQGNIPTPRKRQYSLLQKHKAHFCYTITRAGADETSIICPCPYMFLLIFNKEVEKLPLFDFFGLVDELDLAVHLIRQAGIGLIALADVDHGFQTRRKLGQIAVEELGDFTDTFIVEFF